MERKLALLRAINVGGRKLAMTDLRDIAFGLGWSDVETYIQSGNLIFSASGDLATLESELEAVIAARCGLDVPVIVRTGDQLAALVAANPFPQEAITNPARLLLFVSKQAVRADAGPMLAERAVDGEAVRVSGGALWCHFAQGVGRSKLSPAAIDRACGSPTTGRNFRTTTRLLEMLNP